VLRTRGFTIGEDAARSIIRERKLAGLSPRPDDQTFAQQIFEKELETYDTLINTPSFFERGLVEAVGSLFGVGALTRDDANRLLREYRYQTIFIFPPWEEIYTIDEERDHRFDYSERVYVSILNLYLRHDYEPIEVIKGTVEERANFILNHIRTE
jgi:predicted ATPase